MKPILTLDFDGVLHSYTSGWKGASVIPDPPVPGALEFIVTALDHFRIAVHSSRSHQWGGRRAMKRWMRVHMFRLAIDCNVDSPVYKYVWELASETMEPWPNLSREVADKIVRQIEWPLFKPPSMVSIDDRCLTFTGAWPTVDELKRFKPWNKQ